MARFGTYRFETLAYSGVVPTAQAEWFFGYRPLLQRMAQVPGVRRFDADAFLLHDTHLPCLATYGVPPLVDVPADIVANFCSLQSLSDSFKAQLAEETSAQGWHLRPHQWDAVAHIRSRRGTLLAHQQRLGKTAVVVAAHNFERDGQLLVFAPLATRSVWLYWFYRRWPDVTPYVCEGTKRDSAKMCGAGVIFCHYDIALAHHEFLDLGTVVFDEAHLLANQYSDRGQAALICAAQAKRVILATGTPVWNKPRSLYALLQLVAPGAFGTFPRFAMRYCDGQRTNYGLQANGISNIEELQARLAVLTHRRTWADVDATGAGAIDRQVVDVPITVEAAVKVDEAVAAADEAVRAKATARDADVPTRKTVVGALARLRRLLAQLKVDFAVDQICRAAAQEAAIVCWVWHRDVADLISERLRQRIGGEIFLLTGDLSARKRDALLELWREKGGVLIATIAVAQVGIDLSRARYAIFVEEDWTPAVLSQAEYRIFAKDRISTVTYLVADHVVDKKIVAALLAKMDLGRLTGLPAADGAVDAAFRGAQACTSTLTAAEFLALLGAEEIG